MTLGSRSCSQAYPSKPGTGSDVRIRPLWIEILSASVISSALSEQRLEKVQSKDSREMQAKENLLRAFPHLVERFVRWSVWREQRLVLCANGRRKGTLDAHLLSAAVGLVNQA